MRLACRPYHRCMERVGLFEIFGCFLLVICFMLIVLVVALRSWASRRGRADPPIDE